MTRDALVVLLRARGFVAMSRDWAMGETVLVSHDRLSAVNGGITSYSDAPYVRQDHDGRWTMTDKWFAEHQLDTVEDVLAECERRFLAPG